MGHNRLFFSETPKMGYVFPNEEAAIKEVGAWFFENEIPYRVVKASSVLKEKPYTLYVETGSYAGCYIQKRTSTRVYFTRDAIRAWRFDSVRNAERTTEKTRHLFSEERIGKISVMENK